MLMHLDTLRPEALLPTGGHPVTSLPDWLQGSPTVVCRRLDQQVNG